MKQLILLEFNELCPSLLERWMGAGRLPNFKKFYEKSDVFTATADETNPENLEPWIQWYSIHTGLSYRTHGVFRLTDGPLACHNDIWRMLISHGKTVANCASMNAKLFDQPDTFCLPDPWCSSETPYPRELMAYHRVVSRSVQENSTGRQKTLAKADYVCFLAFLISHGLSVSTIMAIAGQLWSDTIKRRPSVWRRVPLLDKLQFDVFRHYWLHQQPSFSSFFLNSTAHYQHAYWHCSFPEQFSDLLNNKDSDDFRDAILFGYEQMDNLLAGFFKLEKQGATLVLTTALSQRAATAPDPNFYRPIDVTSLLATLGIKPESVMPTMAQQFMARFKDAGAVSEARTALAALKVNGRPVFDFGNQEENALFFGPGIHIDIPQDALVDRFPLGKPAKFFDYFYRLPHTKTGVHHPESVLWFKTGKHCTHKNPVSILDILPTVLEYFDIDPQTQPLEGRSLIGQLRGGTLSEKSNRPTFQ